MKKLAMVCSALLMVGLMAGCKPSFPAGSTLTATNESPYVVLEWNSAVADEGKAIDSYRVDVDGTEVARLDAYTTQCELKGLDNQTTYTISVTAYDDDGTWSETNALTADHLTQYEGDSGTDVGCYPFGVG